MKKRRKIVIPTAEEDAAINAGIAADPDTYELSDEDFKRLKPAREVLPELIGKAGAEALLRKRGRPLSSGAQEQITVYLDKDVIEAFKAGGDGWQNRMNTALKDWLQKH